ncbi:MAG: hypothetical protein P4L65_05340 [Legionella sp.]|nr:hypothetical protein [Legionella sp.]
MHPLVKQLNQLLTRIKVDLILGSANKKTDLERTSFWSGDAVDHTRTIATYEKTDKGYRANFFKLRVCAQEKILPYVTEGANAKFSRAGNCQEHVGLGLYYLFHHSDLWSKIEVVTFDDCFDHVFLRITAKDKEVFYFDSWSEQIFTKANKEHLDKITDVIMSGFGVLLERAESSDEVEELRDSIAQCTKIVQAGSPSISKELSYTPQQAKQFIKQFDNYYHALLSPPNLSPKL